MNITDTITENFDIATKTFVDANERVLDTVVSVNRRIVDTAVEIADRAPKVDLPMADKLPTPAESGARYIDFVERAVSVNRDFTSKVIAQLPTGVAATAKTKATKAAK
ncbi:MAG: hypothetical protein WA964_21505 [Ilumatobacter sp.]|uniref:hypothetical protein n=1 Tax=Ilumatobacter sp. TaxID=1967498 RepID=UPI003C76394F